MAGKKAADPVTDKSEITLIYNRLNKWKKYREAELFLIGCNVALRISDLLLLKFSDIDIIEINGTKKGMCSLVEKKTGKRKTVTFNPVALSSYERLKANNPDHVYLFQATGNRVGKNIKPVSSTWVNGVFKDIQESVGLDFNFSTHTMRKTFGYHAYKNGADINVLQKLFNHSSVQETFTYIGITEERVSDTFMDFSIGV